MAKKSKENKQMLELGSKQRAGHLISSYLRAISTEKTELVDVAIGPDKVERRIVSKGEALARDMVEKALRHDDEKMKLEYRKLVLDRIEGRPDVGQVDEKQKRSSVPDRVSEENKKRINALAKSGEKKI